MTVTVQGGQVSADLDEWLAARGLGLPIIGDHNHITVGGFASVGGISGASHRHGLFADNVVALELVDWDGNVASCSRTERPDLFHSVLLGLGRPGVIATLTLKVIRAEKYTTLWQNDQDHFRSLDDFLSATQALDGGSAGRRQHDAVPVRGPPARQWQAVRHRSDVDLPRHRPDHLSPSHERGRLRPACTGSAGLRAGCPRVSTRP